MEGENEFQHMSAEQKRERLQLYFVDSNLKSASAARALLSLIPENDRRPLVMQAHNQLGATDQALFDYFMSSGNFKHLDFVLECRNYLWEQNELESVYSLILTSVLSHTPVIDRQVYLQMIQRLFMDFSNEKDVMVEKLIRGLIANGVPVDLALPLMATARRTKPQSAGTIGLTSTEIAKVLDRKASEGRLQFIRSLVWFVHEGDRKNGRDLLDLAYDASQEGLAEACMILYSERHPADFLTSMIIICAAHLCTLAAGILSLIGPSLGVKGVMGIVILFTGTAQFVHLALVIFTNLPDKNHLWFFFGKLILDTIEVSCKAVQHQYLPEFDGKTALYWVDLSLLALGMFLSAGQGTISSNGMFSRAFGVKKVLPWFPAWFFACVFLAGYIAHMMGPIRTVNK